MNTTLRLALFFSVVLATAANAASVWRVSDGQHHLYLGGTLHLLSEEDYPLPNAYERAYKDAQTLVFETDMDALSTPAFAQKMQQSLTFQDGRTLESVLTPQTLKLLSEHLLSRQVPLQAVLSYKPSLMYISLSIIELQRLGMTSEGVDMYFATRAKQDAKAIQWFESPDQQLAFMKTLDNEDPNTLMRFSLEEMQQLPTLLDAMKTSWLEGDLQRMAQEGLHDMQQQSPLLYKTILIDRNQAWMPDITSMLATPEVEFVLVGALHLAGSEGLVAMLTERGYTVQQITD